MISKDLKRLGYASEPRGPVAELANRGPTDGLGIVTRAADKRKKKTRNVIANEDDAIPEGEEEEDVENVGSEMSVQ